MKALFAALSPTSWLVGVALVLALLGAHALRVEGARKDGFKDGKAQAEAIAQARESAIMNSFRDSMATELRAVQGASNHLQSQAQQQQGLHDEEVALLHRTIGDLSERLLKRPARPAGVASGRGDVPNAAAASPGASGNAGTGLRVPDGSVSGGATGADLYREDAAWLLEEARRAGELRAAYKELAAGYDAADQQLKALNARQKPPQ